MEGKKIAVSYTVGIYNAMRATHIVLLGLHEDLDSLEAHSGAVRSEEAGSLVHLEGLLLAVLLLEHASHARYEHRVGRVDLDRFAEVVLCQAVLAELHVYVAQPEPAKQSSTLR